MTGQMTHTLFATWLAFMSLVCNLQDGKTYENNFGAKIVAYIAMDEPSVQVYKATMALAF